MNENGGHYCSKKSDDICDDICGQVISNPFWCVQDFVRLLSSSFFTDILFFFNSRYAIK
jgi:hypothetical protein